jgi:subtilisin family serine protease
MIAPMTRHSVFFSAPLFLAVLCSAVSSASAQAPLVAPKLMQRALSEGSVRVIVELGGMTAVPEGFLRDDVAVAIQRGDIATAQNSVSQTLRGTTHSIVRRFETVPLLAVVASTDALRMLEAMRGLVVVVHEDALSAPMLAQSGPLVGAPAAWSRGFDGAGTTIAILDTGVDKNHGFLAGKVVEEACFSSTSAASGSVTICPNGQSTQFGPGSGVPCSIAPCNHGTHVAGIAAGNGAQAGVAFSGIASGATIMAVQVFSRFTTSQGCGGLPPCLRAFNSDLIAGLERVYNLRGSRNLASVNMSLGGDQFFANCDGDPLTNQSLI